MPMNFAALYALRRELAALQKFHTRSLREYLVIDNCGFRHKYQEAEAQRFSKTSSGTCVLSLTSTNRWYPPDERQKDEYPWAEQTQQLIQKMLNVPDWTSAGLPPRNPFTVAFLLEGALALRESNTSVVLQDTIR